MGLYLFISLNFFGRHSDEAFSALRQQDYKNFLRLHISKEGELEVFPIGLAKVPRRWKNNPDASPYEPRWLPVDSELKAHLIEPAIKIR